MRTFTRGNTIGFDTTFFDEDENVAQPDGATITFTYPKAGHWWPLFGDMVSTTYAMTSNADGSWSYGWNSSVSAAGRVTWVTKPLTGNFAFENGVIRLLANDANDFAVDGHLNAA